MLIYRVGLECNFAFCKVAIQIKKKIIIFFAEIFYKMYEQPWHYKQVNLNACFTFNKKKKMTWKKFWQNFKRYTSFIVENTVYVLISWTPIPLHSKNIENFKCNV